MDKLKILWLTFDRSTRLASIFDSVREEVSKNANVTVISRKFDKIIGQINRKLVIHGEQLPKLLNSKEVNNNYDLIFTDSLFTYMCEDWKKINIPKAVLLEDQHGDVVKTWVNKSLNEFGFDFYLVRYRNALKKFHPSLLKKKILWFPHSIDSSIFYNYNQERDIKILSVGRIDEKIYPIRYKLHSILKNNTSYKRINRPSERIDKRPYPSGKDYANFLNRSLLTTSCISKFKYPILKSFEIPACGSILISDSSNEMNDLGFINNETFIEIDKNTNIEKKLKKLLQNKEKINYISKQGEELITLRHTSIQRSKEFIEYFLKELK